MMLATIEQTLELITLVESETGWGRPGQMPGQGQVPLQFAFANVLRTMPCRCSLS